MQGVELDPTRFTDVAVDSLYETAVEVSSVGGVLTIDLAVADMYVVPLHETITSIVYENESENDSKGFNLVFVNDGAGHTVAMTGILFPSGGAPALTNVNGAIDEIAVEIVRTTNYSWKLGHLGGHNFL